MKPQAFDYARPTDLAEAARLLAENAEARIMAGGQSLGPMLNFRLAVPSVVLDISRIEEATVVRADRDGVSIGAAVTHARIEDGAIEGPLGRILARIASGIAYRPVRNRGTIGGSIAHADPAGDWAPVLIALGAELDIRSASGQRWLEAEKLIAGPLETTLAGDECIAAIRIPRPGPRGRFGHAKLCRKPGDFAESLAVAMMDRERGHCRVVLSGRARGPRRMTMLEDATAAGPIGEEALAAIVADQLDRLEQMTFAERSQHRSMLTRALKEALS